MCHEHTPAAISGKTKGIQSITASTGFGLSENNKATVPLPALSHAQAESDMPVCWQANPDK